MFWEHRGKNNRKGTSQTRQPERANLSCQNFVSRRKWKPSGELDHVRCEGGLLRLATFGARKKRKKKLGPPTSHLKVGISVSSENRYPFPSRPIVRGNKTQDTLPLKSRIPEAWKEVIRPKS